MRPLVLTAGLIAAAGIVACLVLIWREFRPLWTPLYTDRFALPDQRYTARHRAPGRVSWLAELRVHASRLSDRAKRVAYLRLMVIPAAVEPGPDDWLPEIAPPAERHVDVLDFRPAADHRWDVLAPRALDAQAHLDRKGLRLRHASPYGTPEDVDVWEPDLVGAR